MVASLSRLPATTDWRCHRVHLPIDRRRILHDGSRPARIPGCTADRGHSSKGSTVSLHRVVIGTSIAVDRVAPTFAKLTFVILLLAPTACTRGTYADDFVGVVGPTTVEYDDAYLQYDAGCVDLDDATALDGAITGGMGPLIAFDGVQAIELGEGRQLWMIQDLYLDWPQDGPAATLLDAQYANNAAVVFDAGGCGTILVRPPNENDRLSFEYGNGGVTFSRFFWPLSGERIGDTVVVFWALMVKSPRQPGLLDGITRHTEGTFIATYDAATFERLSFAPATEPGVDPQWGFGLASDAEWSYLYGNANVLNLAMVGGYGNGPHASTEMFLARVPVGRFQDPIEVWASNGWSRDASDAASISTRGYVANQLRVRAVDDYFVSVTKLDEFWGSDLIVEAAWAPQGLWHEVERIAVAWPSAKPTVSYHPVVLPPEDGEPLVVLVSTNAAVWDDALADPALYRPRVLQLDRSKIESALDTAD